VWTKGTDDVASTLITKAQVIIKSIAQLDAFINKKQWNVIWMKEEYHARFATILQIVYQRKRLTYFSNRIATTFNLANKEKSN